MLGFDSDSRNILDSLRRSNAVIEFNLDGKILGANTIFLSLMGYSAEEVVGKHHSMFIADNERSSSEYADFWRNLRAGEAMVAEFRRFAKGGREVWINGDSAGQGRTPEGSLAARVSPGAAADLRLDELLARWDAL